MLLENPATNNISYFENLNKFTDQNSVTNDFIRRGKIGGYIDEMTEEDIKRFDSWIAEERLLSTGFSTKG